MINSSMNIEKKKSNILLVEDDLSWVDIYRGSFPEKHIFNFVVARNYLDAKRHLHGSNFDIAIVDLGLSESKSDDVFEKFEGFQLVQELASLISAPIVIVSTGHAQRAINNPEFPKDFVLHVFDKNENDYLQLEEHIEEALKIRRIQELLVYASKYTSGTISIRNSLENMLSEFKHLTNSNVCHLLLPTEDRRFLEIVVDTGNDEGRQVAIDDSVSGDVYKSGELLNLPDTNDYGHYKEVFGLGKMESELAVPLKEGSRVIGVLNIESKSPAAFRKEHEALMSTFSNFVVAALQNDHRRQDLQDLVGTTTSQLLQSVVDLNKILETVLDRGMRLINAESGLVALVEEEELKIVASRNREDILLTQSLDINKSICGLAVKRRYAINVRDVTQGEYQIYFQPVLGHEKKSELVVPLTVENEVIGVLNFESAEPNAFTSEDLRLLVALASQAAVAMRITKELEERAEEMRKTERSATVSDLAAGLTHNVNSPANGILFDLSQIKLNCQELLQEDPKLQTYLDRIEKSAMKVLEVPRLIAEKTEQYKPAVPMSCNELVTPKINDMLKKELIPGQVKIHVDETIDDLKKFYAFEYYTPLVIENLVINAVEAMNKRGKIVISTRLAKDESSVEIIVDDNGPGVRKELRDIIFDRSYSKKGKGGIGLWWVRTHLERLKAEVYVEDAPLGGARFVLRFPVCEVY